VRSRAISGKPARQLRSTWSEAWDDPESPGPLPMPLQFLLTAEAVGRIHRFAKETGRDDLVTSPVGQIVGSMNALKPVAAVLEEIQAELGATQRYLAGL
jgi:NAD(P)H-dependent flavin oxidoreductase YrpB (nitropropane dioxygenase family)